MTMREQFTKMSTTELHRRRLEVLRTRCPACDQDQAAPCTCLDILDQVDIIDTVLINRGEDPRA